MERLETWRRREHQATGAIGRRQPRSAEQAKASLPESGKLARPHTLSQQRDLSADGRSAQQGRASDLRPPAHSAQPAAAGCSTAPQTPAVNAGDISSGGDRSQRCSLGTPLCLSPRRGVGGTSGNCGEFSPRTHRTVALRAVDCVMGNGDLRTHPRSPRSVRPERWGAGGVLRRQARLGTVCTGQRATHGLASWPAGDRGGPPVIRAGSDGA